MAAKPIAPPARHRTCSRCGWTSYPRPEHEPGQPMHVTWVIPSACDNCGAEVEYAATVRVEYVEAGEIA